MKIKGLSLLAITVLMASALSACGASDTKDSGKSPSASSGKSDSQVNEAKGVTNNKKFTIRVGAWFLDERPYMVEFKKNVEDNYKKLYPNAKIQWDVLLSASYFDKLKAQFASQTAPDVVFYQGSEFAASGNLADLSGEPWVNRLNEDAAKDIQTHYNGKTMAVPMGLSIGGGVWYNKKIFNDLGLQPPKTTQEWFDINEKIKAAGKTPIALGFKDQWTAQLFFFNWAGAYGFSGNPKFGEMLYNKESKLNEDPNIAKVMQYFETMKAKGYFNKNAVSIDWPQSGQLFASGEAAMIIQGPWMPGANADNISKGNFNKFDIGYFPLPTDAGKTSMLLSSNVALGVNAKTQLMQESKDLVNLITSPDIVGPYMAGDGSLSAFKDVTVKFADPVMDTVKDYVKNSVVVPYRMDNFIPLSANTSMMDTLTKVVSGEKFNPDNLIPAQKNLEKDIGTVVKP